MTDKPSIVFLCVHNAGRSQMAAAFARELGGDRVEVFSGGSDPGTEVNPNAVAAMLEAGIDMSEAMPAKWTDDIIRDANIVVTMGCGDECPYFPGVVYRDWELDDPSGLPLQDIRPIRDEIEARVKALLKEFDALGTS